MKDKLIFSIIIGMLAILIVWVIGVVLQNKEDGSGLVLVPVNLFYYSAEADTKNGNVKCSLDGIVPVERRLRIGKGASTEEKIQATIRELINGNLTESEIAEGIDTEFPLEGFSFVDTSLQNGLLTLYFEDTSNATTGGSCRTGILWLQIEQTALQFQEVDSVIFEPNTLFQP
ncbi:MAG: hypothetical protein COV70_01945 [Parcubacteria group bacterium CG11_big_fil_rev_8_21_14_0_20_39_22]|nr:MAG: hypothetical protein COV70_01945 [Parcubacteria group bacterium CG11_big_fil_rev_8_21_14_0_20_39_22]